MTKIFLGFLAIFLSATMFAAPRTAEQAAQIAAEFTNSQPQFTHVRKSVRNASNLRLAHTVAKPASITIIAGTLGTTYYSSIIDSTPPTAIDNIETNTQTAIKRIENGQLVIIMDGKKFNAFGQTIE